MHFLKRALPAVALFVAAGLTACKDSVGPEDVDPDAILAATQGMINTFDNASFQSMAGLSVFFPTYPGVQAAVQSAPLMPRAPRASLVGPLQQRLAAARVSASLRNPMALFPSNVLGKTFEWSVAQGAYVIGNRTGAPANGVRIVLYTVSTITGEPTAQELGYLELTDESSAQLDQLGVLITLGTSTVADYVITHDLQTSSESLGAEGFIRNASASDQVDFDFIVTSTSAGLTSLVSDMTGSNSGRVSVDVSDNGQTGVIDVTVGRGENHIDLHATGPVNSSDISGTVKYNGTVVANITGTIDAPVFTAASGRTLRPAEVATLANIFGQGILVTGFLILAVFAPGIVVAFL